MRLYMSEDGKSAWFENEKTGYWSPVTVEYEEDQPQTQLTVKNGRLGYHRIWYPPEEKPENSDE